MYKISFALLSLLHSLPSLAECDFPVNQLGAFYTLEQSSLTSQTITQSESLNLWRSAGEVAQEFPQSQITDIWNLVSDGRVRPVRYFDEHQRAIEYQPNEVNDGHGEYDWSIKFQLVSDSFLDTMTLLKTEGEGCDLVEIYQLKIESNLIELDWLPYKKLVQQFTETQDDIVTQYNLINIITDNAKVLKQFAQWHAYQSTDYADIGDDHTDPFLLKMVNLGFIE